MEPPYYLAGRRDKPKGLQSAESMASYAADLVEYLNAPNGGSNPDGGTDWTAWRAQDGHPEPCNVTWFEFGTEEYEGYRHFFHGGAEGRPEQLADVFQRRFPGLQVAGTLSPPFRLLTPEEDKEVVRMINEAEPDIVWVGLGCPKQGYWMGEHRARLTAPVLIGVGAAFDFLTGRKPQIPCWMQRAGLGWLFRLLTEPRRFWGRYFLEAPPFLVLTALQLTGLKDFPLEE